MVIAKSALPFEGEVADRTAVGAATDRFELVDQLHRPHLGRAGEGARWKEGVERVEGVEPGLSSTLDLRDQVHEVRVALDVR